jgi:integrase
MRKKSPTGIRVRHARSCPAGHSARAPCKCSPSYEASVYSVRDGKKLRKSFPTLSSARAWRSDAGSAIRKGTMRTPTRTTLREAADACLAGAREGSIRTRSGDPYKPSAIAAYDGALRLHLLDDLGAARLSDIGRADVQDVADRPLAKGLDPSTVRNALMPLRAIYRRALARGEVAVNPTTGVELPAVRGCRDRIASPAEAAALIEALPEDDRALWATALYAGLRECAAVPTCSRTSSALAARTDSSSATGRPSTTGRCVAARCGRGRRPGSCRSGCTSAGTRSRR